MRILLVDDDDLVRGAVKGILEQLGHVVQTNSSGEEALRTLGEGNLPEVVLLDMNMPGLGGHGTLPRLRAMCPDLPVMLVTGRADQTVMDLLRTYPRVSLLPKPFTLDELQEKLYLCMEPAP